MEFRKAFAQTYKPKPSSEQEQIIDNSRNLLWKHKIENTGFILALPDEFCHSCDPARWMNVTETWTQINSCRLQLFFALKPWSKRCASSCSNMMSLVVYRLLTTNSCSINRQIRERVIMKSTLLKAKYQVHTICNHIRRCGMKKN